VFAAPIERDAISFVRSPWDRPTRTVRVRGSLSIVHRLVRSGDLDELDLFIAPVRVRYPIA
jgi:hypothetical protein